MYWNSKVNSWMNGKKEEVERLSVCCLGRRGNVGENK